jgi:nucleotide-binding universal stress UspA family protein
MTSIDTVAVGIGLLGKPDPVLSLAGTLALDLEARLHAVHMFDPPAAVDVAFARESGSDSEPGRRAAEIAKRMGAHVKKCAESARPVCHVIEGQAGEALVGRAGELGADLLIVGATRQDRIGRHYLGTTAQAVIADATMPVLVVRQPVVRPLKRVLLTSNLSELSRRICRTALAVLRALFPADGPELRCLLVIRPDRAVADPHRYLELATRTLATELGELRDGAAIQGTIRKGDPAEWIVREAEDWRADLLVLGSNGFAGRRRGIGDVAGMVLREVARNLLVIPASCAESAEAPPSASGSRRRQFSAVRVASWSVGTRHRSA